MADATRALGDEAFFEWAVGEAKRDGPIGAAGFEFTGRGGFELDAKIVEAAGAGEAGIEGGIEDILAVAEHLPGMGEGEALEEILGRDAGPIGKEPVEMECAEVGLAGEGVEAGLFGAVLIQETDDTGDAFVIIHMNNLDGAEADSTRFLRRMAFTRLLQRIALDVLDGVSHLWHDDGGESQN